MSNIRFRLAKPGDAKQIASCHWHVRDRYKTGIFLSLGESFLREYYKIILNDPNEVFICAENEEGKIIGFNNATLDVEKQTANLKNHKIRLGLAAFKSLLLKPSLIPAIIQRYKSLDTAPNSEQQYISTSGARAEYWCWLKDEGDVSKSVELNFAIKDLLFDLGVRTVYSEVDKSNKNVYKYFTKYYKKGKIEILKEIILPDGRERAILKETLDFKR